MEPTNSLVAKLRQDFPALQFMPSEDCQWSPSSQTVYYNQDTKELLHELGHALLGHSSYNSAIELISMERDAWSYAHTNLSIRYGIPIDAEFIEDALDSYREWLHRRSTCVGCGESGLETTNGTYRCLICKCQWRANEARLCSLRRYKLSS